MINRNQRKREFLNYVLKNYKHVDPSVNYLLEYLATEPDIITHVIFSDQASYAPLGVVISYEVNTTEPFSYYKNQKRYSMVEQAYHDLRLNQFSPKDFYFELYIPDYYDLTMKYDIFQENPYFNEPELEKDTDMFLSRLELEANIEQKKKLLNKLLDEKDYEKANELLVKLEELRGELDEFDQDL